MYYLPILTKNQRDLDTWRIYYKIVKGELSKEQRLALNLCAVSVGKKTRPKKY
jgi:hypothetical protein